MSERDHALAFERASNFREAVLRQLGAWAELNPSEPVFGAADSGEVLTRRGLYEQVNENRPLGNQLMAGWEELAAEYVLSAQLNDQGNEAT